MVRRWEPAKEERKGISSGENRGLFDLNATTKYASNIPLAYAIPLEGLLLSHQCLAAPPSASSYITSAFKPPITK